MTEEDKCIGCEKPTAFGSGLFVNRIPADNGEREGYLCVECQSEECDRCSKTTHEFEIKEIKGELHTEILCWECNENG